ncbi:hypothetical protein POSPLADRAFT_1045669 [Postia placenta MAD-698-R-SB12]|uniref:BIR-domain-containing protein n=1 Tax=Postia placenta MAD-698-R-SB12 TaxID=670580 RepID=A0A1X6N3V8_9APHY|nr:hypothetical protein POSPLADRAFT_1045669 [Postia placenta MAD-698-R-SB12]OSX63298.1 hypothetical protein POSPLADRAFT_1045669 [Postia placenta MAD-698-R-SB12]
MAATTSMQTLQARLDSFKKSKRTKQSLSRSTSANSLKWPHPSSYRATPQTLADAGFYYDPSLEDRDNVICFMCEKELSDWDADDDPFEIHWDKCRSTCPWAAARCGLALDVDERGNFHFTDPTRFPTSKTMEKARLETFTAQQIWPHDSVKGHGASSKKMAKAGFVFTPQFAGDDTATCLYCNLSLSGWDEDDDPQYVLLNHGHEEHVKREKKSGSSCAFFMAPGTRSTKPPPSKAVSKPPTLIESDDELAGPPPQETVPRHTRTKSGASRASSVPAKTPASRRSTRGTSKAPTSRANTGSEVEDTDAGASESDAGKRVSKAKRRAKAQINVIEEEEEAEEVPIVPEKPKRGRPPKAKKAVPPPKESAAEETNMEPVPAPAKNMHTRTRSRTNLESESEPPVPSSSKPTHPRTKSSAKSKTAIAPAEKIDEEAEDAKPAPAPKSSRQKAKPVEEQFEPASEAPPAAKLPAKGSKVSRSKFKRVLESNPEPEPMHEEPPRAASSQHKVIRESSSTRKGKARAASVSSVSDDAGYATAEPPGDVGVTEAMAVDPTSEGTAPPDTPMDDLSEQSSSNKDLVPLPTHGAQAIGSKTNKPSKRIIDANGDVVMANTSARGAKDESTASGRSTPLEAGSVRVTKPNRVSPTANSDASRSSRGSRSKEKMTIVEIPSDGEDTQTGNIPAQTKHRSPVAPTVRDGAERQQPSAPARVSSGSHKAKQKLQVEIVLPLSKTKKAKREIPLPKAEDPTPINQEDMELPSAPDAMAEDQGTIATHLTSPSSPRVSPVISTGAITHIAAVNGREHSPAEESEGTEVLDSPDSFTPLMAMLSMTKLTSLTEEEASMTVEQYIKREIERQYKQLKVDGEQQLAQLREKAAATRKAIEAL